MSDPVTAPVPPDARAVGEGVTLPVGRSLRFRLALFLALAIAFVIGAATYLQSRVFERTIEQELSEAARLTALAVADDLELREGPFSADELTQTLREFVDTAPELRSITVVTMVGGRPEVFAGSTRGLGRGSSSDALDAGQQAIQRGDLVWKNTEAPLRVLAVPLTREAKPFGAVIVVVSFDALVRLRNTGRVIAAWSTALAIVSLFVLVELLTRWLIHRPIGAIRDTVAAVAAGTLQARAPVLRRDELGAVATGLNQMLDELQGLHGSLQSQVDQATADLRQRNRELLDLYQQMFRLREELGRAQQLAAVGETTAAVAHQIATPLNLVSGHIQLLLEQHPAGSAVAARLRVAEEQIRKVTAVVQRLLDRSRRSIDQEPIDISQVISRLCALVQPALGAARVRLSYVSGATHPVAGDVAQLELALLNLVSNALDAMPEGGDLTIRASETDGVVRIDIADTGVGIPPAARDHIFDPWYTTKEPGRGTGLGLSVTRSVIAEHGGRIEVQSEPGRGTTMTVILPVMPPAAHEKAIHA